MTIFPDPVELVSAPWPWPAATETLKVTHYRIAPEGVQFLNPVELVGTEWPWSGATQALEVTHFQPGAIVNSTPVTPRRFLNVNGEPVPIQ